MSTFAQSTALEVRGVRVSRVALLALLAVVVFAAAYATLARRPAIDVGHATGLYAPEGGDTPFQWTSSRAEYPLVMHAGTTRLHLVLSIAGWPRQEVVPVRLETDTGLAAQVAVTSASRRIDAVLPPGSSVLRIISPIARPPGDDWRWLGVQVMQIDATPSGLPVRALAIALALAVASVPLALGLAWAIRAGYGPLAVVTLAGLALRLVWLADIPPLMHRDETVSLVDAWSLAQTGRDHLGHLLPLAAFEAYGDWLSPMLTYVLLPWIALFGPQPLIARIVVAVFGTLAIPVIYGLVRELRLPTAAIWAAAVTALSPWQIFVGRVAIQPALVATTWSLCIWAALRFIRLGGRRDAVLLALAAGFTLYAYPTLKLAVPMLLALAVPLALSRHSWRAVLRWWPAALVVGVLWTPFLGSTLLNPASSARLELVGIKADSPGAWMASWWNNYRVYFSPNTYYGSGNVRKIVQGLPDRGLALGVEAILLLGLLGLPVLRALERRDASDRVETGRVAYVPWQFWALLVGVVLIAPFPASLTSGHPHVFRASPVAAVYAILVGIGAGVEWVLLKRLLPRIGSTVRMAATALLAIVLVWQCSTWVADMRERYPGLATATWFFADRELDAMQRVIRYAPEYDQTLIDIGTVGRPYIFLLADQAMTPAEAQAQIVVVRDPPNINAVTQMGKYRFVDFDKANVPWNLPGIEAIPTSDGGPGYLLQEWQTQGRRVLVMRGMTTQAGNYADDTP